MIDLNDFSNSLISIHNMLNDLEVRGGNNARIVVYIQENCKRMINQLHEETTNDHHGSAE